MKTIKKHYKNHLSSFFFWAALLILSACGTHAIIEPTTEESKYPLFEAGSGVLMFSAQAESGSDYDVYALNLENGDVVQVTDKTRADISPSPESNGKWFIFSSNRRVFLVFVFK